MYKFFELFLNKMRASFRNIAKATKHEMTVDDLKSDAWIVAHEISQRRGRTIDFSDPDDASLIIRAVNVRNVKCGDWKMRSAVRMNRPDDGDDNVVDWSERLAASASSDPLVSMLQQESALDSQEILTSSYSQAAAYVIVLAHFNNEKEDVCTYLAISRKVLATRVTSAANSVRVQSSLFDRIERMGVRFMPPPGWQYPVIVDGPVAGSQWGWEF